MVKQAILLTLLTAIWLTACNHAGNHQGGESAADKTWPILPFERMDDLNPVLTPGDGSFLCPVRNAVVKWEEKDVFNPAAIVREGKIFLLYRAEDTVGKFAGTSRIGLATSADGFHFERLPEPVFYPDNDSLKTWEWEGGIEDPRIVETEDGRYAMTYTAYDGHVARLLVATSGDLIKWQKHGLALGYGKYRDHWSKSGAIVCRRENDRLIASKINGKYWMYWGDTDIFAATSDDLLHWQVLESPQGEPLKILSPRPGKFDCQLVEPGPPALLTDAGIVLIYNSRNLDEGGDPHLPPGTYAAGQALFDKSNPAALLDRLDDYFFKPEKPYEITGQIGNVCFLEALVPFQGKWLLYYGTADSKIAVAVKK